MQGVPSVESECFQSPVQRFRARCEPDHRHRQSECFCAQARAEAGIRLYRLHRLLSLRCHPDRPWRGWLRRAGSIFPLLLDLACWSGAAFLVLYGVRSFHAALNPGVLAAADDGSPLNALLKVVLTTLALTLLNPHVYLDTVLLLGSLAAQYPGQARMLFAVGAMAASFVWFFGLGYGARIIEPLFRRPAAWRILDVLVGCTMWFIAGNLVWSRFTAG